MVFGQPTVRISTHSATWRRFTVAAPFVPGRLRTRRAMFHGSSISDDTGIESVRYIWAAILAKRVAVIGIGSDVIYNEIER